jgi:hypothetical protein
MNVHVCLKMSEFSKCLNVALLFTYTHLLVTG